MAETNKLCAEHRKIVLETFFAPITLGVGTAGAIAALVLALLHLAGKG